MTKLTQSYYCGASDSQIIYETIGNYLDRVSEQFGDKDALVVCHQDIRWNYCQLRDQIDRLATGLLALGIGPSDRVGIWGPNSYEWVLVQYATAKIGAIMVCINPAYRVHELEYALAKVECKAIVTAERFKSSEYLQMLESLVPELLSYEPGQLQSDKFPLLETVIRMGTEASPGMFNFAEVCDMGTGSEYRHLERLKRELKPDDAINIQFTSGTTGSPKGATLTHCNILNNGFLAGQGMGLNHEDRLCIPVPLYHCFGMVLGTLACLAHGAAAVFPAEAFDPLATLQAVQDEKCTALHGVPTMFVTELNHPQFDDFDLSRLRTGIMAGAPCPVEVMKRVIGEMHMRDILIGYGQTEVSPLNHLTLPGDSLRKRTETVGRAVPWVEIKLVDEHHLVVPVGEKGEICTRGYSVMQGYWNDEERTREAIDMGGWLHSGDLGVMDGEGYVSIVGRLKDMIIRGGENIYPREVEDFLYTHPDIAEAQVFGVPDDKMGEEICVWVHLNPRAKMSENELRDFCKEKIAHYKIPLHIRFVDEFPMTVTGKIQKFVMRERTLAELSRNPSAST